jgi:O-antigen biosynthesis protein
MVTRDPALLRMAWPTAVLDLDLGEALQDVAVPEHFAAARVLVRHHRAPLGHLWLPLSHGVCRAETVAEAALEQLGDAIMRHLLSVTLADGRQERQWDGASIAARLHLPPAPPPPRRLPNPTVTVAVCTRERPASLAECLASLERQTYPALDLLVVDNAPRSDATERVVARHPRMRYIREPRPGLDWARNRAIAEARGDVIAFTDDDATADPNWAATIATFFTAEPDVTAVTGLVAPRVLDTGAQVLFERLGGFGRGYTPRWYHAGASADRRSSFHTPWIAGTGANMAFRRAVFQEVGMFDPALDVGTVTNGGGDLEMFFRLVKEGHVLAYEPGAIVFHTHRRTYQELRRQLHHNAMGFSSFAVRSALAYPDERLPLARRWLLSLPRYFGRQLVLSYVRPGGVRRDLLLTDLVGRAVGLFRYPLARRLASRHAPLPPLRRRRSGAARGPRARRRVLDLNLDLDSQLPDLPEARAYAALRLRANRGGRPIGDTWLWNGNHAVSALRLGHAIVDGLGARLLEGDGVDSPDGAFRHALARQLGVRSGR